VRARRASGPVGCRMRRIATLFVIVAALGAAGPRDARALCQASDVIAADPGCGASGECRITRTHAIDNDNGNGCVLDFSGRDLTAQEFTDSCAASAPWSRALARANASVHAIPEADHTFSVRTVLEKAHLYCACWLREVYPSAADPQRTYQPIR